jgi:glycosyltransferase involved in cell wall biosynthesis
MESISLDRPSYSPGLTWPAGRRILVLGFDLFQSIGGGQSAYQRLIALNPDDTFYYMSSQEDARTPRAANVVPISYQTSDLYGNEPLPRRLAHFFNNYQVCRNIAVSIKRQLGPVNFDVVDTPDYNQLGLFIREALEAEGCGVRTVSLALHGTLSSAWRKGWPTYANDGPALAELYARERLQARVVDSRYALSDTYAAWWERQTGLPVNRIDPRLMVAAVTPNLPEPSEAAPDLIFVGRREKWKGPDLFLDLAWWIERTAYSRLLMIGPDGLNRLGHGSADLLRGMARQRDLPVEFIDGMPQADVHRLLQSRSLLLLPSRQDTFNLVALEALSHGCPVLVSDRTGFAAWLRVNFPELDWMIIGIDCSRTAASKAEAILCDYDHYRGRLVDALARRPIVADPETLASMYTPADQQDLRARQTVVDLAAQFSMFLRPKRQSSQLAAGPVRALAKQAKTLVKSFVRQPTAKDTWIGILARAIVLRRGLAFASKRKIEERVRQITGFSPRTYMQMDSARQVQARWRRMVNARQRRHEDIEQQIAHLSSQVSNALVDRARLFRELMRLERQVGHDLVAATYGLRLMRWLGRDAYGDLPFVVGTLRSAGFRCEADVADAMFGAAEDRFDRCADLIQDAFDRNRSKPDLPLAVLDDRRRNTGPRLSAIVSLYNAADKLPTLLETLRQQTLAQRGELEVVLIDSNSPTAEYQAFTQFAEAHDLPIVYAKSAERETIQAAWNRGIKLSRAPYLTFLGVDEGVHPDALRQLTDVLDGDMSVDWAMADSLVTNVDRQGVFASDIMPYDRRGYRQDLTYLETCYLSWVGGVYRRSIHDRFGWYDESFRAAGDTEFKNRIMPHIRSVHVPRLLGVFNNYPEERTTQSPRAEIEDLRAWYLWRTPAGMQYAFGRRPAADAEQLFRDALNYRKSFCGHLSTDFDLAASLAEYLAHRPDSSAWVPSACSAMAEMSALLHSVEQLPSNVPSGPGGAMAAHWVYRRLRAAQKMAVRHARLFSLPQTPHYEIFNDNRYEQHWWAWTTS